MQELDKIIEKISSDIINETSATFIEDYKSSFMKNTGPAIAAKYNFGEYPQEFLEIMVNTAVEKRNNRITNGIYTAVKSAHFAKNLEIRAKNELASDIVYETKKMIKACNQLLKLQKKLIAEEFKEGTGSKCIDDELMAVKSLKLKLENSLNINKKTTKRGRRPHFALSILVMLFRPVFIDAYGIEPEIKHDAATDEHHGKFLDILYDIYLSLEFKSDGQEAKKDSIGQWTSKFLKKLPGRKMG